MNCLAKEWLCRGWLFPYGAEGASLMIRFIAAIEAFGNELILM